MGANRKNDRLLLAYVDARKQVISLKEDLIESRLRAGDVVPSSESDTLDGRMIEINNLLTILGD